MRTKGFVVGLMLVLMALFTSCGGAVPVGDATLEGTVVDATSSAAVPNAEVCLVWNGDVSDVCATTDASGAFSLTNLPEGSQTFQVTASGYTPLEQTVSLASGATITVTFALNPQLNPGEYRVVLSWSSDPADLDSHLWVPLADGTYYEVYFGSEGDCTAEPWACLDVDDQDGYGPETITISQVLSGTYSYAVHWYAGTGSWADSDAVVKVYDSNGLVKTYYAPNDTTYGVDSWWYVFDLDGDTGAIITEDVLSDTPPLPSGASVLQAK